MNEILQMQVCHKIFFYIKFYLAVSILVGAGQGRRGPGLSRAVTGTTWEWPLLCHLPRWSAISQQQREVCLKDFCTWSSVKLSHIIVPAFAAI